MRRFSRRAAVLLTALALTVPTSIGATATTASAATNPLCGLLFSCPKPAAPAPPIPGAPNPDPAPKAPAQPGTPGADSPIRGNSPIAPGPAKRPDQPADPGSPTVPANPADPTDPNAPGSPTDPATPDPTESPTPAGIPTTDEPVEATDDADAPVFAKTPASMGSQNLSFTGLSGIAIVNVPTADGGHMRAIKISADSITIKGFSLTVRPPGDDEPGLVTKADTMTLKGHVNVYLGSITATTKDGKSLTIGTDTPPPLDDVEPGLLRVTMGLVGSFADTITYDNTDQEMVYP